MWTFIDQPQ